MNKPAPLLYITLPPIVCSAQGHCRGDGVLLREPAISRRDVLIYKLATPALLKVRL